MEGREGRDRVNTRSACKTLSKIWGFSVDESDLEIGSCLAEEDPRLMEEYFKARRLQEDQLKQDNGKKPS
jgi:hypothetical protein